MVIPDNIQEAGRGLPDRIRRRAQGLRTATALTADGMSTAARTLISPIREIISTGMEPVITEPLPERNRRRKSIRRRSPESRCIRSGRRRLPWC